MGRSVDKQPRLSLQETRDRLLCAGRDMLLEFGLENGIRGISLAEAIERSGVSRTSAYRVFTDGDVDPQENFRGQVVLHAVETMEVDSSMVAVVFAQLSGSQFDNTPVGQAMEMRELIRRWSAAALESNLANTPLRAVEAIMHVVALSQSSDPQIVDAVRLSLARSHEVFLPLYQLTIERYGLRFRPGFNVSYLTALLSGVAGMAMTEWPVREETREVVRPTGPGGSDQVWTATGVLAESVALLVLEPDPDASDDVVSADLSSWISA